MKKPLSEKGKGNPFRKQAVFGTMTDIDPAFKSAALEKGYELRWLNYKELIESQGQHKRMWEAAKRTDFGEVKGSPIYNLNFGSSPDGFIRRGTMILGKRSKELCEQHREALAESLEAYKSQASTDASNLRESARQAGVETIVSDRYDDK